MRTWITVSLVLTAMGCGSAVSPADDSTGSSSSSGSSSGPPTTATSGTSDETLTSGASSSSSTDAVTSSTSTDSTSTGPAGDSTSTGASTCAMDILFVVDNSGSMEARIVRLLTALPEFLNALDGIDLRAMVVDVDGNPFELCATACDDNPECFVGGACEAGGVDCFIPCAVCEDYGCDAEPPFDGCAGTLGAGIALEQGEAGYPTCDFASGERWIDNSEPSFAEALSCAANVGTASTAPSELVMQSMVAAVDSQGDAAPCNEGFLRPEAGLAVVIVTDEDDGIEDSEGNPAFWQLELESSQRDDERIVVLAITGDNGQDGSLCTDKNGKEPAEVAPRIQAFVERFEERGLFGSVCAVDYAPPLLEAATAIAATCE